MICGGEKEVTLPYVMVPGLGAPEDYEGLDVAGKIAVVQRGVLGFSEKANYAAEAGAVGCILYNNQAGSLSLAWLSRFPLEPWASLWKMGRNWNRQRRS